MSPIQSLAAEIAAAQDRVDDLTAKRDAMVGEVVDAVFLKAVADGLAEQFTDDDAVNITTPLPGQEGEVSRRYRAAMIECGAWEE